MNKTSIRWIKALLREGIMVARPSQLKGIRRRIEAEAKKEEAEKIIAVIQTHFIEGSRATLGEIIELLKERGEMNYGFHSKNGLFFERDAEGNVIIRKVTSGRVMFKVTLDADSWASVICSVSSRGDAADNFQIAKSFHMGGPPLFVSV